MYGFPYGDETNPDDEGYFDDWGNWHSYEDEEDEEGDEEDED
ncbi:MAG: hypothetical protein ACXWPI_08960 [Ktedonobacterales bacterium]